MRWALLGPFPLSFVHHARCQSLLQRGRRLQRSFRGQFKWPRLQNPSLACSRLSNACLCWTQSYLAVRSKLQVRTQVPELARPACRREVRFLLRRRSATAANVLVLEPGRAHPGCLPFLWHRGALHRPVGVGPVYEGCCCGMGQAGCGGLP